MEYINKRISEPRKLVKFRKKYKLDEKIRLGKEIKFNHLDQTIVQHLRNILLEDQGYICCYCQRRIPEKKLPKSKIEHLLCQENNKDKVFDFRNLFIACNGKIGEIATCDTSKDSNELEGIDLLDLGLSEKIKYTKKGFIYSTVDLIDKDIEVLKLNDQNLMKTREAIYGSIKFIKNKIKSRGDFNRQIAKVVLEWESKDYEGKYKEYKRAGLYYLK